MSGSAVVGPWQALVPESYRVVAARREVRGVVTIAVAPADGRAAPQYEPGQFDMLYARGIGEIPVSISGSAAHDALLHTIRGVGAVSTALASARTGSALGLRGPYGTAWPLARIAGRSVVVVAGGLGLAPLREAIRRLLAHRERYGRILICCGARSPRDVLFLRELRAWRRAADVDVRITVDRAPVPWTEHVGVVTALLPATLPTPTAWTALICGPEAMMRLAAHDLVARGLAPSDIHVSVERNMKCAVGLCGRCQFGAPFVCRDGPVFPLARVAELWNVREL